MEEKKLFKGIIEKISYKITPTGKDMYFFNIGDMSFSGFGKSIANEGELIEFEYKDAIVGDKVYHNVTYINNVKKVQTPGEIIGESAKKKRMAEMMMVAKDIIQIALRDEKLEGSTEQKIVNITNKVTIVWKDLCRQIGELDANTIQG